MLAANTLFISKTFPVLLASDRRSPVIEQTWASFAPQSTQW